MGASPVLGILSNYDDFHCIAESMVCAYMDRPYLVITVYKPCSRGPDKVKLVNGHSTTLHFHLETIKTTKNHFLVFEVH